MSDQLILVGAGGFGLEVAHYAEDVIKLRNADMVIAGYLDDTKPIGTPHGEYQVIGTTGDFDSEALYLIALGKPEHRRAMAEKLTARGARFATLLHPAAYIARSARIGVGSIVAPFAFIGPQAVLGSQVLVNVSAVIGHGAAVGDYCALAPHAAIHGEAQLNTDIAVGSGAVITNGQHIGARSVIAPGAVVFNAIFADSLVMGNPAKFQVKS